MIQAVNAALLELQSAVLARALYPDGHPRVRGGEERALTLLRMALAERPEVTVFCIDDRVIFGEEVLPASASLATALFGILRERGVDRITFKSGIEPSELTRFLDALAASDGTSPQPIQRSAHLRVGSLVRDDPRATPVESKPAVQEPSDGPPAETAQALAQVWQGVYDTADPDAAALGDIVSTLTRVVHRSSYTILPLAFVKNHDEYTFVHIINVGILSMSLGEALGFDTQMTHDLGVAALLHDVGKMAVPLEVLNKAGRFTEEEYKAMQVHPVEGARILLRTRDVPELAVVVAYEHHVRYDGGGYPKVPQGWKLNLASRICQIADVYDALRTDRPYRAGMPPEKILKIMKGDSGTYFDPELLTVFLEKVMPRAGAPEPTPEESHAATTAE